MGEHRKRLAPEVIRAEVLSFISVLDRFYSTQPSTRWILNEAADTRAKRIEAVAMFAVDAYLLAGLEPPLDILAFVQKSHYIATRKAIARHKRQDGPESARESKPIA